MAGTALETIEVDDRALQEVIDRLEDEAPTVAAVMQAMAAFTEATAEIPDLYPQTHDMRRSHLAAMVALADTVRERLGEILADTAIEDRLADADTTAPIRDGLGGAGEALTAVAQELTRTPERDRW